MAVSLRRKASDREVASQPPRLPSSGVCSCPDGPKRPPGAGACLRDTQVVMWLLSGMTVSGRGAGQAPSRRNVSCLVLLGWPAPAGAGTEGSPTTSPTLHQLSGTWRQAYS